MSMVPFSAAASFATKLSSSASGHTSCRLRSTATCVIQGSSRFGERGASLVRAHPSAIWTLRRHFHDRSKLASSNDTLLYSTAASSSSYRPYGPFPINLTIDPKIERQLDAEMQEAVSQIKGDRSLFEMRHSFVDDLNRRLQQELPASGAHFHLFGSSRTETSFRTGDCDICLTTPEQDIDLTQLTKFLEGVDGIESVVPIFHARVPIVKFHYKPYDLSCDVNINNVLGIINSKFFFKLFERNEKIKNLIMLVKYWAKFRDINDVSVGGTLSSYSYINLILFYLQQLHPHPLLPPFLSLKDLAPQLQHSAAIPTLKGEDLRAWTKLAFLDIGPYVDRILNANSRRATDAISPQESSLSLSASSSPSLSSSSPSESSSSESSLQLSSLSASSTDSQTASAASPSIASLFCGFLNYYAFQFDYADKVVCTVEGKAVDKRQKGWPRTDAEAWYGSVTDERIERLRAKHDVADPVLAIEDPFDSWRNVGQSANAIALRGIRGEMFRVLMRLAPFDQIRPIVSDTSLMQSISRVVAVDQFLESPITNPTLHQICQIPPGSAAAGGVAAGNFPSPKSFGSYSRKHS